MLAAFAEMQLAKLQQVADHGVHEESARALLHRIVHALAEEPGRSPALVRSILAANLASKPVRELVSRNWTRGRRALAQLIARAQERGEIRRDRSPDDLALFLQQSYFGALLLWTQQPRSELAARLDETLELFWFGVHAEQTGEVGV